jgi:hypothetical protein
MSQLPQEVLQQIFKSQVTTLNFAWENCAPPTIRRSQRLPDTLFDDAAPWVFETVRECCPNSKHVIVGVDAQALVEDHADGSKRAVHLQMDKVRGLEELKALLEEVHDVRGGVVKLTVTNDTVGMKQYLRSNGDWD